MYQIQLRYPELTCWHPIHFHRPVVQIVCTCDATDFATFGSSSIRSYFEKLILIFGGLPEGITSRGQNQTIQFNGSKGVYTNKSERFSETRKLV